MAKIVRKVRDRMRDLLQTHGTSAVKQKLWDTEFARGRWDVLDTTMDDCVYSRIEKAAKGGSILDLGCGSGNTPNELGGDSFSEYIGVDISEVALEKAQKRTEANGRAQQCRFFQGDVTAYEPTKQFDVILFRDSIYYIRRPQIVATLMRYAQWLREGGVFIVRIWDGRGKLKEFADIIKRNFDIVEEYQHQESGAVVLVFRCHSDTRAA
jgi:2-polyprenyl-6-hydroxyphenyl methylase/3-demethylubiquinone-9 3-methyltransferase